MTKILVTGSKGYIGSILCKHLREYNYEVIEFDKVLGDDILDGKALLEKSKDVDKIIHMAAIVGMQAVDDNPSLAFDINIIGTQKVLECNKKVIYASVLGAYDGVDEVTEETETTPKHRYFIQKLKAEKMIRESNEHNIVLRFGTLYGVSPSMRSDLLIHTLIKEAVGGKIKIFQPDVMRAITSIVDAVEAITFFSTSKNSGGLYNIVSQNCTKRSIAEIAAKINNADLEVVDEIDSENRNYIVSTKKIKEMGFAFHDDLTLQMRSISKYYEGG